MKRKSVDRNNSWSHHKFGFLDKEKKMSIKKVRHLAGCCRVWMSTVGIKELARKVNLEEKYG